MKVAFKNNLTLKTVPSKMTKAELSCSIFTWMLVFGFIGIMYFFFFEAKGSANYDILFVQSMLAWGVVLVAAIISSFIIDIQERIFNIGTLLWVIFLIYIVSSILGKV